MAGMPEAGATPAAPCVLRQEVFSEPKSGGGATCWRRQLSWGRRRPAEAEAWECAVCLEELRGGDVMAQLPCAHCFHWTLPDVVFKPAHVNARSCSADGATRRGKDDSRATLSGLRLTRSPLTGPHPHLRKPPSPAPRHARHLFKTLTSLATHTTHKSTSSSFNLEQPDKASLLSRSRSLLLQLAMASASSWTLEIACSVAAPRLFRAGVMDWHTLAPKVASHVVASAEPVEGEGGVGSVRQFNYTSVMPFSFMKEKLEFLDVEKCECKTALVEGGGIGVTIESATSHIKVEPAADGGCVVKVEAAYKPLPGVEDNSAQAQEAATAIFKAAEAYLVANPDAYN